MSLLRPPFLLGFALGFLIVMAVAVFPLRAVEAQPAVPVHELADSSWPYLTSDERRLVDLVARDVFERELSKTQRVRIGGSADARFEDLEEWRKAPFRGTAMKRLGHSPRIVARRVV